MTCKGFIQLLLKVINFLFTLLGLAMIGYGIYMVVVWSSSSSSSTSSPPPPPPSPPPPPPPPSPPPPSPPPPSDSYNSYYIAPPPPTFVIGTSDKVADGDVKLWQPRRALLQIDIKNDLISVSSVWSNISSAWFLYVFIAVGVVLTLITCSGYIAAATANGCCLSCYTIFLGLLMILELALAGFIFFDNSWQEVIPDDSTGELENIEDFVEDKFDILKWVALGLIIVQAFALLLAIILRALGSKPDKDYDSDDEYVAPRASRQPLLNRQATAGTGASVAGSDGRPTRTDAWSTRMREKYGLDTTEFTYNPLESKKSAKQAASTEENKSWCTVM